MRIMSTNFAKTSVWKHAFDVKLWRHKQRTPNTNDHHMPLNETPHMKIFCVRSWWCLKNLNFRELFRKHVASCTTPNVMESLGKSVFFSINGFLVVPVVSEKYCRRLTRHSCLSRLQERNYGNLISSVSVHHCGACSLWRQSVASETIMSFGFAQMLIRIQPVQNRWAEPILLSKVNGEFFSRVDNFSRVSVAIEISWIPSQLHHVARRYERFLMATLERNYAVFGELQKNVLEGLKGVIWSSFILC